MGETCIKGKGFILVEILVQNGNCRRKLNMPSVKVSAPSITRFAQEHACGLERHGDAAWARTAQLTARLDVGRCEPSLVSLICHVGVIEARPAPTVEFIISHPAPVRAPLTHAPSFAVCVLGSG